MIVKLNISEGSFRALVATLQVCCVLVSPAVVDTAGPVEPDVVLHEERRHDAAVEEVADSNHEYNRKQVTCRETLPPPTHGSLLLTMEWRFLLRTRMATRARLRRMVRAMMIQVRISHVFRVPLSSTGASAAASSS